MKDNEMIDCCFNNESTAPCQNIYSIAEPEDVRDVTRFHMSLPKYMPTPLVRLKDLAEHLGVCEIFVKDESRRFDLNAFKVLGASYAMARSLVSEFNLNLKDFTFKKILNHIKKKAPLTFVTATDGNHGRAVAWAAEKFGCKSVVFMPKGSSRTRIEAIRNFGADASILDCNYDEAVNFAAETAEKNNWILMQDSSWPGYEKIPTHIMQGYFTLLTEAMTQVKDKEFSHVFVQAGVGSLPAAISAFLNNFSFKSRPAFVVVEAKGAPCFLKSIKAGDGKYHTVHGNLDTIMAGLACGKPSKIAWEILKSCADVFVACSDEVSKTGMRVLGNPIGDDTRIISGESGAVTLGLVYQLLKNVKYNHLKDKLEMDNHSKILLFSTEGDTDPVNYRKIVWQG